MTPAGTGLTDGEECQMTSYRLVFKDGRPSIEANGEALSYAMYHDNSANNPYIDTPEGWLDRLRDFVGSGVKLFSLSPCHCRTDVWGDTGFWTSDGVYPDVDENDGCHDMAQQAEDILGICPEARFIVRFGDSFPSEWINANPNEVQTPSDGSLNRFKPSMASKKGLADLLKYFERIVGYCESKPWAERVIAYLFYPHGEGVTLLNCSGHMFDCSPVMQEAFRGFAKKIFKNEGEMREAWGEPPGTTYQNLEVPTDAEWAEARKNTLHFTEGNELRKIHDYMRLQQELFMDWYKAIIRRMRGLLEDRPALFGMDIAKQPMMGWQLNLAFGGIGPGADFYNMFYASGSIGMEELLEEPGLDLLVTPADYTARTVGYGWEPEGLADPLRLRGKTIYTEDDCRTPELKGNKTLGAFNTGPEVRAGMLRNAAWALTRGHMNYWMTPDAGYFHLPLVHEEGIKVVTPLYDMAPRLRHAETEHAIAMILDDESPKYENGTSGYQNLAVLWQRVLGLSHCGIPYRIYLLSDLRRGDMPDFRCYLFPNLFMLDDERLGTLSKKVFKDGRISIFGPATGITDGKKLSAEWASRVTGVEMEMFKRESPRRVVVIGNHDITRNLPSSLIYGDSQHYGPVLVPAKGAVEKAGGMVLGEATTYYEINRPGLFVRDAGSHKVAFSVAVPLPGNLLRELARYGGCNVWCEEDDVVFASDTIAAIHSVKEGPRVLKLPSARNVADLLTGEGLGMTDSIKMEMGSPETRIFSIGIN
ncbi:MAG: hypothetical protein FWF03_01615 [Defluviitaleaceae bacterium]|nr:hypothetical protein [Defluviitaleaceae bacterium]